MLPNRCGMLACRNSVSKAARYTFLPGEWAGPLALVQALVSPSSKVRRNSCSVSGRPLTSSQGMAALATTNRRSWVLTVSAMPFQAKLIWRPGCTAK